MTAYRLHSADKSNWILAWLPKDCFGSHWVQRHPHTNIRIRILWQFLCYLFVVDLCSHPPKPINLRRAQLAKRARLFPESQESVLRERKAFV
jgi:hypothetical protein